MPATAEKCFDHFLQNAKTRSEETMQKWEKTKTSLDSNFDNFYEQECLKVHPDLPKQVLAVLRMLHSRAKDSIEAMFNTCSVSQHEDVKYFGNCLRKTQVDVMRVHEHDLRLSREETNIAKTSLKNLQEKIQTRINDQSDMMPGSTPNKRGSRERRSDAPGSGGITFERAQRRSRKKSPRTPVFSTSRPKKATTKRQNQKLEPIFEPVTRDVATRSHARSPARSPARTIFREQSAHTSPEASPPTRDPSTSRKPRSPKSNQSHYEAFKDGKLDNIHPLMRGSIETSSELNQECEDNLVMVNDTDLENMDDDDDEWQDDEDYVPRRSFDELSVRNSRLVDKNKDLDKANADLLVKNNKSEETIKILMKANKALEQENEELHSWSSDRGLPADTNQINVGMWDSAGPDLDIPSSPEETEQREVPAMLDTPPTAGKAKSPLSVPPSPPSHHNVSTGTSKLTSPVSPDPSDTVSLKGSIQGTPTKASTPIPGSLHRFNTSDMSSSQYPDTMSGIVARLRAAVARCNIEVQMCQKEMKTSRGHETSSNYVFECWQNAIKKHRHDFLETVMYFESVKTKPPPSKDNSRAGSSSFGGSTRSFGSPPPSSSMGNSFESDFVGGLQRDAPERVSPEFRNAPEPTGPKRKPQEPERVQESSPMKGSSDKKGSTKEGGFSSSGDGSKKNQSESKPQTQPQDSQENFGPKARTRGFKAWASFQHLLAVFFCWGLPLIQKRGTDLSLAAMFPVLTSYYLRFDRWMDRQVRKRLPSYVSSFNAAITMLLTIGFLCLYIKMYNVYLVLLRERNMWLEANRMASTLMLKRAAMSSKVSVWGLSEEQGLIRGVGNFVEFMCWSLGVTTLRNWILEECAAVCQTFYFGGLVVTTLLKNGIHEAKVALFGGP